MWKKKVLYRNFKGGRVSIPGFHIDYALTIEACIDLYESTMDSAWLELAFELTESSIKKFYDESSGMFRYNAVDAEVLITNHQETQDNVIPSSNSVMAGSLFRLGHLLVNKDFLGISARMVEQMGSRIGQYPNGFSAWGSLLLRDLYPFYEVAVLGPDAGTVLSRIQSEYLPQVVVSASPRESDLPLFKGRYKKDKTHIFVCRDNVCQLPLEDLQDAKAIYHHQ